MSTLAVLAHYDPHGLVAPHVRRHAESVAEVVDRLLIVSTAALTAGARAELSGIGELVERTNEGYDFCSWQYGLAHAGDWRSADRLVLTNDSVVGPLRPLADVLGPAGDGTAVRGIVRSDAHGPHLQSFLLAFGPAVLRDPLFAGFWLAMTPLARRAEVVLRYEVGLGRLLTTAGYTLDPAYVPSVRDRLRMQRRVVRRAASSALSSGVGPRRAYRSAAEKPVNENLMIAAWDAALDGRLPYVKIETLRDDPAGVGRRRMLGELSAAHPAAFAGVEDYLQRTGAAYAELRADDVRREKARRKVEDRAQVRKEIERARAKSRRAHTSKLVTKDRGALR